MSTPSFQDLITSAPLHKAIDSLGYERPTPVQLRAIPEILAGRDVLVSSKTGSGKTAAFLLPSLQLILERAAANPASTRILILTPTRELARQIVKNAEKLLRFTSMKVAMIGGGEELKYQKAVLRKNPEIIVGTPGRLAEHIAHKSTDFSGLDVLVLDEADRMLDMGLSEDVLTIVNTCASARQTLLFSATLETKGLRHLIQQVVLGESIEIDIDETPNRIVQQVVLADDHKHKEKLLVALLASAAYEKVVVFTNTKVKAAQLDGFLRYHKYRVSALHGDVTQDQRKVTLDLFRLGKTQVLVATDVAARGLDIPGVDLVINFDMAHSGDDYLHRIGRTGRADTEGRAVSFVAAPDWNLAKGIERYLQVEFEKIALPGLTGSYKGPDKTKSSGKAVGAKKKESGKDKKAGLKANGDKISGGKAKVRERDKKNIGKRRMPSNKPTTVVIDGFAPPKKKINRLDDGDE